MQDGQDGHSVVIHEDQLTEAEKTERQRLRDRFMIDHMVLYRIYQWLISMIDK